MQLISTNSCSYVCSLLKMILQLQIYWAKFAFSTNFFVILLKMIKFAPKSDKTQNEVSNQERNQTNAANLW